jgi:hypothetical protein
MSVRTRIENQVAAERGTNLPLLDIISPETAVRWRQDNILLIDALVFASLPR